MNICMLLRENYKEMDRPHYRAKGCKIGAVPINTSPFTF